MRTEMPGVMGTFLVAIPSYTQERLCFRLPFPFPETLEDALGNFHITLHPQTKHRAKYIVDGSIGRTRSGFARSGRRWRPRC